jgi:hypothetical protein
MTLFTYLLVILFLVGLYFYIKSNENNDTDSCEGFTNTSSLNKNKYNCPNMLIQKDSKIYLYNSKLAKVPGVNPVEFDNLEDYVEFLDWQRSQGVRCPVLFLQMTYDAQGNPVYRVRPSVTEPQAGIPPNFPVHPNPTLLVDSTRNDMPYNKHSYPAFDQSSYYVGTTTPLDKMDFEQEQAPISPNAMDPNWGGPDYTQKLVDAGYYADNEVAIRVA